EKGSAFRRNALAGISVIQQLMSENKMGTAIVIDNEKMKDYYANNPLKTYGGTEIDAKSYSNMVISSTIAEVSSLPILEGRSVFDKTEFLTTLSTPGWLSISKHKDLKSDENIESVIDNLFNNNEVLANMRWKMLLQVLLRFFIHQIRISLQRLRTMYTVIRPTY